MLNSDIKKLQAFVKMQTIRNPELQTALNLKPEPKITIPNLIFMFKARLRPDSQMYRVSQDVPSCEASVA